MLGFGSTTSSGRHTTLRLFDHEAGACRRLVVVLVRPSKYDDEGYVIRHFRGTLPSNTLSCLNSLTEDVVRQGTLGDLDVHVEVIDEIVSRVDPVALGRRFRRAGTRLVVGLVGVQTNQFPRAQDLARQFLSEGFAVMIGGFHVSGSIAMAPEMPTECQEMLDAGVTLVLGEVEDAWAALLKDAVDGHLRPLYNFLGAPPDLHDRPMPRASLHTQRKFVLKGSGTIDAGRGCPFSCSFCTIINVQGRRMRCRNAEQILGQIRDNYVLEGGRAGVRHYFFTDDNFVRNPEWEAIFDGLIALREQHGIAIGFMMQVDVLAPRVPGFVEKAARAGCVQVFIGMETMRDDNLEAGGKPQNKAANYREVIAAWHEVGVVCHVGYIIGFPNDTYERVMEDVRALRDDLLVDQASFFILMPLPGSQDHATARASGVQMETDFNRFDGSHVTTPHPRMTGEEWLRAYHDAWTVFYAFEPMRQSLLRQNPHTYWAVLKNLIWYRAGMSEHAHPMVTGFFRLKDRTSRRPGFPIEGRAAFRRRRVRETAGQLRDYAKIYLELQELWLLTRIRYSDYEVLGDLRTLASKSMQEVKLNWARIHAVMAERLVGVQESLGQTRPIVGGLLQSRLEAMRRTLNGRADTIAHRVSAIPSSLADLRVHPLPPVRRRTWLRRAASRLNVLSTQRLEAHDHLREYWERTWSSALRLEFRHMNPFRVACHLARDTRQSLIFLLAMWSERY